MVPHLAAGGDPHHQHQRPVGQRDGGGAAGRGAPNFLVTHFFNPPRYMRLMEIVPCRETDPAVVAGDGRFHEQAARQGIVYAKDTTNFIANRIGVYAIYKGIQHMVEMGMTVEEVDASPARPPPARRAPPSAPPTWSASTPSATSAPTPTSCCPTTRSATSSRCRSS
jgi:hypothetical protein